MMDITMKLEINNLNVWEVMDKELECTKIKDGLYLGNIKTAQVLPYLSRMQSF